MKYHIFLTSDSSMVILV